MIVKVNVLSPFRYEYQGRKSWVATGEALYLDTHNKDQRQELKYIMSSNFPFKEFIYLDVASLPEDLKCEVKEEGGFYNLPSTPVEKPESVAPAGFFNALGEAEDNKFLHPVIQEKIEEITNTKDQDDEPLVETKVEEDCVEECIQEPEEPRDIEEDKKSRKAELNQTPWNKVKDILEAYGNEYTNKSEAIEKILEIEF